MSEQQEDCAVEKPRLRRLIEEHEVMKATLGRLEPSIASLIAAMDKLADKVGDVHENHGELDIKVERYMNRLLGAIIASTAMIGLVTTLVAYIYITDQRATERHILALANEHKLVQEQQARSAAERELLFKALLRVIDKK